MNLRSLTTLTALALLVSACQLRPPPPGAVPLRDTAHMRAYLSAARAWQLHDVTARWVFDPKGGFVAEAGDGAGGLRTLAPTLPAEPSRLTGRWRATTEYLELTGIRDERGNAVPDRRLSLTWLDGKRLIEIDGVRFAARWR